MRESAFLLGIDTCGPSGSVALGRQAGERVELLGQTELAGRSYSSTLVAAVGELLVSSGADIKALGAIVAVYGPGSFTGVRVGLSAAKGLAEAGNIPVAAVSRLALLAWKAGAPSSALDAHRHEVFLRLGRPGRDPQEMLAGIQELASIHLPPAPVAVCDDGAAALLAQAWPDVELARVPPPTAANALAFSVPQILAGEFADLVLLDGHYLRRSDAEIFGEAAAQGPQRT